MVIPTLDQTEGIWMARTEEGGYYYIQDVFPDIVARNTLHRDNCHALLRRGSLVPEQRDAFHSAQGVWESSRRYCHKFY
ncbi:hypothetical protein KDH_57590 [Dictyobacter sp. S3.2.2.5]|uniref:Uncharacterized protein n=1 Tax=Dictyobacter halimunensis TaxID=3026934 RepID=A0ABQ6G092_9CHLR|nr:hypothetical protein KDH_57590 [Dictyobacter sp. S3.2.2.5]